MINSKALFIVSFLCMQWSPYIQRTIAQGDLSNPVVKPPIAMPAPFSLKMVAINTNRDSFNIYYVQRDGRFAIFQHDKQLFDNLQLIDKDKSWKITPVNFVYYDGRNTIFNSFGGSPADYYVKSDLDAPLLLGESIHVKACVWPFLPFLSDQNEWTKNQNGTYTLPIESIATNISVDENGKLLAVRQVPSPKSNSEQAHSWEYSGYTTNSNHLYPTTLIQRFLILDANGETTIDETTTFSLEFYINPEDFDQQATFDNTTLHMDRYDLISNNVYDQNDKLLYNAEELTKGYNDSVGHKNPTRTRNILFTIIGLLGIGSIIIWKRKAA